MIRNRKIAEGKGGHQSGKFQTYSAFIRFRFDLVGKCFDNITCDKGLDLLFIIINFISNELAG